MSDDHDLFGPPTGADLRVLKAQARRNEQEWKPAAPEPARRRSLSGLLVAGVAGFLIGEHHERHELRERTGRRQTRGALALLVMTILAMAVATVVAHLLVVVLVALVVGVAVLAVVARLRHLT